MLIQQLKELEKDGIVTRTVYRQRPPRVDTRLPTWAKPWGRLWPNSSIGPYMRNEGKPKGRVPGGARWSSRDYLIDEMDVADENDGGLTRAMAKLLKDQDRQAPEIASTAQ
jgi:hypothetical protein